MARELFRFKGGVHPPDHKSESNGRPIHPAPIPRQLVIPLRQHIGNPAKPVVSVGDTVRTGQLIAEADGTISAAVHASSSGTVVAIEPRTLPHASGLPDLCVVIDTDGRDEWVERAPLDYRAMPAADLRMKLRDMGLAGLGGRGVPQRGQARCRPGTGLPHADSQRRRVRTLDHL
jgi:Predicted NADH:ubiquinone oxidoreductase, subunit RnfC